MNQPPTSGQTYGRFRIDEQIGMGGMGVVYTATDTVLNRTVALKLVSERLAGNEEFRARFQREADALSRLDSPHIITIFDHGEDHGVPFIATQYVAGGDLGALLRSRGPMPLGLASGVCAQVAGALSDAHRIGIVHRDVKASNVLVRDPDATSPHVYLCDFGIAKSGGDDLTQPGGIAGSWAYLSPERADGAAATPTSDVYAVGCLLWVCLTGNAPFVGSDVQVVMAHQNAPVPQLLGEGPETAGVNAVLARSMAKDPADRYPDATALQDELARIARTGSTVSPLPAPVPAAAVGAAAAPGAAYAATVTRGPQDADSRRTPRRRTLAAGAVLVLVAGAGVAYATTRGDDPTDVRAGGDTTEPTDVEKVTGDLDGDGFGDVLLTQDRLEGSRAVAQVSWLSTGTTLASSESADRAAPGRVHLADVDGDGLTDLVAEGESPVVSEEVVLTFAPGSGEEDWTATFGVPSDTFGVSTTVLLGDVDGDGMDDVVLTAHSGDGRSGIYVARSDVARSEGSAVGELEQWYGAGDDWTNAEFLTGDFDGDGDDDLFVRTPGVVGADGWRILVSDGEALTGDGEVFELDSVGRVLGSPLTGDFDGDGDDEIVLMGGGGNAVAVFEVEDGEVTGFEDWVTGLGADVGGTYGSYGVTDLTGDGRDDLIWLRDPVDEKRELQGLISTGEAFEAPQPWGVLDCAAECEDSFRLVQKG